MKRKKPKYNMFQNAWFMIRTAWSIREKKVIALAALAAALAVCSSLLSLYVTPAILAALTAGADLGHLLKTILTFLLAMMLTKALEAYIEISQLFGRITVRSWIITLINRKASVTSYPNVNDSGFRTLLNQSSEAVGNNSAAAEAVWDTLLTIMKNLLGFSIYLALLSAFEPLLMGVILVTAVTGYFVSSYLNGYGYRHREEEAEHSKKLWYISQSAAEQDKAKDIRIFGMQPWLTEVKDKALQAYMAFHRKAEGVYIWAGILDLVLAFLRNALAYAYLIHLVLEGAMDVSDFLLMFTAVQGFSGWVTGILSAFNTLNRQSLDLSNIRELLDYPEEFAFEEGEPLRLDGNHPQQIELRNVSFRYKGAQRDALSHINLTLRPGEKLAIVGLNGAGKTTLVKLICGFLDPTEGEVLLNGENIKKYNRRDYYKLFSAVFQDFSLLAVSVAANVAQSETDIDMDRVVDCVKRAGLHEKIASLRDGYHTHMNRTVYEDAVMLSGGETQKLMLARALYKDACFIVLDEPTAALDPIAESEMYLKYNELTRGKTSVYISHRLASTRFCDRILFVDNAGLAEEGTHDELMRKGGKYAELFEIQSKYYREGEKEYEE